MLPCTSAQFPLLLIVCVCVCTCAQLCPTFCDPMDCSLPCSFAHGILQARILEWLAISFSRGSSWPRGLTHISCISFIGRQILYQLSHYSATKRNKTGPFVVRWMDLESVIQSKVNQKKKNKYHMISYINIYVWNLEKMVQMKLFAREGWRHRCREQTCGHRGGCTAWEDSTDMRPLPRVDR